MFLFFPPCTQLNYSFQTSHGWLSSGQGWIDSSDPDHLRAWHLKYPHSSPRALFPHWVAAKWKSHCMVGAGVPAWLWPQFCDLYCVRLVRFAVVGYERVALLSLRNTMPISWLLLLFWCPDQQSSILHISLPFLCVFYFFIFSCCFLGICVRYDFPYHWIIFQLYSSFYFSTCCAHD